MQTPMFAIVFFKRSPRVLIRLAGFLLPAARRLGIRGALRVFAEVRCFDVEARRARHLALQVFPLFAEQAGPL